MENLEDEVLVLKDQSGKPELIVCAVPYLRDRDIRTAEAGESIEDKERKLVDGIKQHYANVAELSERKRAELGVEIPIVAMGHLFTAGGQTVDGDGVRELYVGTLAHVSDAIFPAVFNYVALGHLHIPQTVRGSERIRYSGSPIPMGFGEATQKKGLCQVDFQGADGSVELIEIPCFQRLESIKGDLPKIKNRLLELSADKNSTWTEVIYEGDEVVGDLRDLIEEMVKGNGLEILRIKNNRLMKKTLGDSASQETLDDLNENEVFERCLIFHEVSKDQWPDLLNAYQEILTSVNEVDLNAE
jgi:exonuclease SbcD